MIKLIFSAVLVFHGLLHLIGFVKEWNLDSHRHPVARKPATLPDDTSKTAGTVWLLAGGLFLTAAVLFLLREDDYWLPAAAGVLLSQSLIFIYWKEARYGTVVNAVIVVAVVLASASMHFSDMVDREVRDLEAESRKREILITAEMISSLPGNVRRWMHRAGVVDQKNPNVVRLEQKGKLRSQPGGKWMPFHAVQHFTIDPPAFVWHARIKAAPLIYIGAKDRFENGQGHMLIKPMNVFTAANSTGPEIDQGTLMRYLAELAWFPYAAVSRYLKWEEINEQQAKVTMTYGGTTASGVYFFNAAGDVTGFEGLRYGDFEGAYRKEIWSVSVTGYKTINNKRIGNKSEVTWKLKAGDFTWLRLEITKID